MIKKSVEDVRVIDKRGKHKKWTSGPDIRPMARLPAFKLADRHKHNLAFF
jgi:hypothetical protein